MVTLFTDPRMLDHRAPARHPERPERLQAILRHLERTGCRPAPPGTSARRPTTNCSGSTSRATCARSRRSRPEAAEPHRADTWVSPGSLPGRTAGRRGGGRGGRGRHRRAAIAGRSAWSGRPATMPVPARRWASASSTTSPSPRPTPCDRLGLDRVLIVDFDVHHGNGTQEIFYDDPRVGVPLDPPLSRSIPAPARRTRPGPGRASGITRNIPLPFGTPAAEYHAAFRSGLEAMADRIRPELVLISAGFDAHAEDPVGDLGLEVEDFETHHPEIVGVAETHAAGADRQRPGRGLQRADPGRLRRGPPRRRLGAEPARRCRRIGADGRAR